MNRIKVAYLDHAAELGGGAEEALVDLLRFVDRSKVAPVLIVAERTDWLRGLDLEGIEVVRLFSENEELLERSRETLGQVRSNLRSLRASISPVRQLASELRRHDVDIVHSNSLKTHVLGGLAARLAKKPLVWDVRDILDPGPACRLLVRIARLTRPHIVAMSGAVAEFLRPARCDTTIVHGGRSPEHFVKAEPSPQLRAELNLTDGDEVITVIARLTPWKGHMVLLDAFRAVHVERPRARLLVVGAPTFWEETYLHELQERAEELGCAEAVRWLGFRDDIPQLLALSDMMVLPSFKEPFGIVVVEAMIAARPVIACDSGGPPEIVEDGVTGLIVPTAKVGPLAEAMLELLGNPERARQMGEAGRQRALTHFDIRVGVRKIEQLYQQIMDGKRE
ncbi:MAG: glycosyltransferase family 4 protein [Armatimonadota bacterium]